MPLAGPRGRVSVLVTLLAAAGVVGSSAAPAEATITCGGSDTDLIGPAFNRSSGAATSRVSVNSTGGQARGVSGTPALAADGRLVAFHSSAANLVPRDGNGHYDVFVRDRGAETTTRVSVASDGTEGRRGPSLFPSTSADGRFVVFVSAATNLIRQDVNGKVDVFVHDRATGETQIASVSSSGVQANEDARAATISGNGRYVALLTAASTLAPGDTNGLLDVYVRDLRTKRTVRPRLSNLARQPDGSIRAVSFSFGGRYMAFSTDADNIVAGDTNRRTDAFVFDRELRRSTRVSVSSNEAQATSRSFRPTISGSGRIVVFRSKASNLVPRDTNGQIDAFVRDRAIGRTRRVSVSSRGVQANGRSYRPTLSGDGRYVVFGSSATNLVPGDTNGVADVFLRDRLTGETKLVSIGREGQQSNGCSLSPEVDSQGPTVAFMSGATNLVDGDSNASPDIFVRSALP